MKKYKKPIVREIYTDSEDFLALDAISYNCKDDWNVLTTEDDCQIDWEHGHGTPFAKYGDCWIDED